MQKKSIIIRLQESPAEPKAIWYFVAGLNLTQHTFALASNVATECSIFVAHSFTRNEYSEECNY